ncbi:ScbR family autoregulator-binding transcription factor [Streptomyces sp. NPDC014894]|uniref:ScbR family autoregulator-binding transcription factor n=1 Tax=unclassified Streptomyces TaxID=2593676 RepID=UPI0036FFE784
MQFSDRKPARQFVKEPKQERARRTKAHILQTAAEAFTQHGYAVVSLQDIADRALLTKGAVYFHFTNKEALGAAVVHEHYARWQPLVDEVRSLALPPLETLLRVLDRMAEAFCSDPVIQAGARLQTERSLIRANLPTPYVGCRKLIAELAERAREAGELKPDTDAEAFARVVVSAFFGMQHVSDVLARRNDLMERYAELREALFRGVVVRLPIAPRDDGPITVG